MVVGQFYQQGKTVYSWGKNIFIYFWNEWRWKTALSIFPFFEKHRRYYCLTFIDQHEEYTILVKRHRGPRIWTPFTKIENDIGEDITTDMLKYLGPAMDFFGMQYTPDDFGYRFITVFFCSYSQNSKDGILPYTFDKREILNVLQRPTPLSSSTK